MTFRSFSRFVRWYRWELLLAVASVPFLFQGHAGSFAGSVGLYVAFVLALPGSPTNKYRSRVRTRHWSRKRSRRTTEASRLRSLPLRGWTK